MSDSEKPYEGWAIVELMGHRRLAGLVSQAEQFGVAMLRVDVPGENGEVSATQFYGGSSIYCLTPTTEEIARAVALRNRPEPVARWELPAPKAEASTRCRHCGVYDGHDARCIEAEEPDVDDDDEEEEPPLGDGDPDKFPY